MAEELIPINILIADRTYRIRTLQKDEEVIRKTLKLINDKIIEYKTQFAGKDMQDYISMVLIWYATQPKGNNSPAFTDELMESLLKRTLQVKDSGNAIPGHGGFLDRFDSMILAAPMIFIYLSLIFR